MAQDGKHHAGGHAIGLKGDIAVAQCGIDYLDLVH
jgi:hypothetical protein